MVSLMMAASLSFLEILGLLGATVLAIVYYYFRVMLPYSKLPSERFETRLVSCILRRRHIVSDFITEFQKISTKHEKDGLFVGWLGSPHVVVFGEDAVKTILNEPAAVDKSMLYSTFKHFLGSAILISNGKEWRKLKKIVYPAFHLPSLKDKIPIFNKHSKDIVKTLSELNKGTTDQVLPLLRDFTLRMFIESSLGLSESEKHEEYNCLMPKATTIMPFVIERMMKPWLYPDFAMRIFPSGRRMLKLNKEVATVTKKIMEDMKEKILSSPKDLSESYGQRSKLLGEILIKEHLKDPSFTMDDVFWQTLFITTAGSDSSAVTVMWCLFLLGHDQDVQERVYRELQELESKPGEDLCFEELRNLEYLECVIKESMRIYSVIPIVARKLNKDVQIGKYEVPKNASLIILMYCLHKNAEIFTDPEKFDPERFRNKDTRIKQWNYFPFAEGVRGCPGKMYALIEMKLILTHILRKFKVVSFDDRKNVELSYEITFVPLKPLRLQFIERDSTPLLSTPNI